MNSINKSLILTQIDGSPMKNPSTISYKKSLSIETRKKDYPDFDEYQEFDFSKNSPAKKTKEITKGQKLIQKLRFIMKFKQKSELFERIKKGNEQKNEGEKTGYSTGTLIRLYPDISLLESNGEIEKLSRLKTFSSEIIIDSERLALPISEFFYFLLLNSLDYEENKLVMVNFDIDRKDQNFILEMLCDHECIIIQKIFMVKILKCYNNYINIILNG